MPKDRPKTIGAVRGTLVRQVPILPGVYALCDLDETPLYVGKSVNSIRGRVRRHLTSARSDVIANRMIDVWEIAYVWSWPTKTSKAIMPLEGYFLSRVQPKVAIDERQRSFQTNPVPQNPQARPDPNPPR